MYSAKVLRVCLVDDDSMVRSLFTRVIERAGCSVATACGPAEAIQLLTQSSFDVLISDLRMPEIDDGEHLLNVVKQTYPSLPVFMMSGDWAQDTQSRVLSNGASGCLVKPFTTQTFKELLNRLIQKTDAANSLPS